MTPLSIMPKQPTQETLKTSRRTFLRGVGKLGFLTAMVPSLTLFPKKLYCPSPVESFFLNNIKTSPELALTLYNTHTGESLKNHVFWAEGQYIEEQLQALTYFFRDHRTGDAHAIDKKLLNLLSAIADKIDSREPIHLISGYRSSQTNKMLCDRSSGVAKNSQHLFGKAADIMIPGRTMKQLQEVAKSLRGGGVGRYANFVHVDTGRLRYWGKV